MKTKVILGRKNGPNPVRARQAAVFNSERRRRACSEAERQIDGAAIMRKSGSKFGNMLREALVGVLAGTALTAASTGCDEAELAYRFDEYGYYDSGYGYEGAGGGSYTGADVLEAHLGQFIVY